MSVEYTLGAAAPALVLTLSPSVSPTQVLVPRLKQLSDKDVSVEYSRQQLLGQYAVIAGKADEVAADANEDIRVLARLWQLQSKMESVAGAGGSSAYGTRIGRVQDARDNIESRLGKKLELLDGYARVMNMIEVWVDGWEGWIRSLSCYGWLCASHEHDLGIYECGGEGDENSGSEGRHDRGR